MKTTFSSSWKNSIQPRKQRKYRANAPLHVKGKFMHAPLSKELRKKYNIRSLHLRKGDKVKVLRGQFKGVVGRIENLSLIREFVNIAKAEILKKDGSKQYYPIHPSNVIILEIESERKRQKRFQRTSTKAKQPATSFPKTSAVKTGTPELQSKPELKTKSRSVKESESTTPETKKEDKAEAKDKDSKEVKK